ncbi:MAG: Jag N-terminal domain-containing protein [Desulfobulbaceae bacterium]|nr:Jag N-terminal domain-containing protein [Desulfobulbaceae bacterium]
MTKLEFKGKDVDEAIINACNAMHVTREELDIEILSTGSVGIFGLCRKKAVILAATKNNKHPAKVEGKSSKAVKASPPPEASKETTPAEKSPKADRKDRPAKARKESASPVPQKQKSKPSDPRPKKEKRVREPAAPLTPEILEQLKNDLHQLLVLMKIPSEIEVVEENNKAIVTISGDHLDQITANDGQILDSLQYLMRKIIGKKFPQKTMLSIDADNFRENRKKELHDLALKLAEEVKETEKTRTIPPLNPSERRIVHVALQDDKTIRSRSVGDGIFKKILIYLPGKGRNRNQPSRKKKGSAN